MTIGESAASGRIWARLRARGSTLGARLIASHIAVLLLALALVLLISAAFLRRYEAGAEIARLKELAVPLTVEVWSADLQDSSAERRIRVRQLFRNQAQQMNVRLLLINPQNAKVVFDSDTGNALTNQTLAGYQPDVRKLYARTKGRRKVITSLARPRGDDDPLNGDTLVLAGGGLLQPDLVLGISAPPRRLPLLGRFLPPLLIVVSISLIAASLAGLLLSRRIAAPIKRLTRAADAMEAGNLEQIVPVAGPVEVERLVQSFNSMSRRLALVAERQRAFLADIAHELRTPLTSIQGYTQALRDGVIETEGEQFWALVTISRESDRIATLVRQFLELARLESGQVELIMRPVPVDQLLERLEDRFMPIARQQEVELFIAKPGELAIAGDDERLLHLLSNLVANALAHTPAGGSVSVTAEPNGNDEIYLRVHDTGEGITSERLPYIFDRFVRKADEAESNGFGLGLAIVQQIVQLHHGTAGVESEPGVGTTFTIVLPAAEYLQ